MDTEAGKVTESPGDEKHDITSYVSPSKSARPSLADTRRDNPNPALKMVSTSDIQGTHSHSSVGVKHIVKIFTDDDDFIEGE